MLISLTLTPMMCSRLLRAGSHENEGRFAARTGKLIDGMIAHYDKWLQIVLRHQTLTLFVATGTAYGAGDGTTTFNLPDLRGRVTAFLDNMGGSAASRLTTIGSGTTLGATGGEETHTLLTTEIPAHTHVNTLTDPGHRHDFSLPIYNNAAAGVYVADATSPQHNTHNSSTVIQTATTGITITNASAGGDGAHNNLQPTLLVNCIMRII